MNHHDLVIIIPTAKAYVGTKNILMFTNQFHD